jgi:AraC-like DNA-binding protein
MKIRRHNMQYNQEPAEFSTLSKEGLDLIVYQCGMEKCKPSHSYGPAVRDHFLIHFILEGCGTFYVDGKSYKIKKNQGFLICPDIITYYEADSQNPWVYTWVGFKGIKAEGYLKLANLDRNSPIFEYNDGDFIEKCFDDMIKSISLKYGRDLRLLGILNMFLSELIEKAQNHTISGDNYKDIYIKKTLQFIEANFSRDISIAEVAKNIGLNKNYFSNFFKESVGISPMEYLIKYRINKACDLMRNEQLSISDISRSVGYNDPLGFSKMFKKIHGESPKKHREKLLTKAKAGSQF